ncbi:alanine racemase [Corynebacterium flavescens]|uniref:alanine racemase n=1 Tax=Corynebacterium flavescens TaxID=28028 RepID=UPI003FD507BB
MLQTRIDLDAIAHNVRVLKEKLGPVKLMCILKADAYGHGMERVAPVMEKAGADAFGVATLAEAVALRKHGSDLPITAWLWDAREDLTEALASRICIGVPSLEHAKALINTEVPARVYIKVETGMHRSGVDEKDWGQVFELLRDAAQIEVLGLMSHFACADEPDTPYNDVQEINFRRALVQAREAGLECPLNHLANSPATLTRPSAHFEQVRVGLACYGLEPVPGVDHGLRPAMTWAANLVNVKPIEAGQGTCYGLTWKAKQSGFLATVPCGYADGLPRAFQGKLQVGIGGKLYPQVGRVCMDQIVVDLGDNPFEVAQGDEAIIFGAGGMSATELADAADTINYEVLCLPTGRTVRAYEGGLDLA